MDNTLSLASHGPIIPVIVLHSVQDAVPLARALLAGGVKVLEVTLRSPVALACIAAIARAIPEVIVGAGTVRSAADAQGARDAGSRFAVSPRFVWACSLTITFVTGAVVSPDDSTDSAGFGGCRRGSHRSRVA